MKYRFVNDIKLALDYLDFSYASLANSINVREETICRIVKGDVEPSNDLLDRFYSFLFDRGININQLKVELYKKDHNVILFHGSKNEIVGDISLDYSDRFTDFGRGFYAGETYEQSLDFVSQTSSGAIYVLDVDYSNLKILNLEISTEWMLYIAISRGKLEEYKNTSIYRKIIEELNQYDVIIAPIADNRMFTTIEDFVKSAITTEQAVHALKDLSLGKQIVFKSNKAIKQLKVLERLFVSSKEREQAKKHKIQKINDAENYITDAYKRHARQGKYISEVFSK